MSGISSNSASKLVHLVYNSSQAFANALRVKSLILPFASNKASAFVPIKSSISFVVA
jgi:hypothetical protein